MGGFPNFGERFAIKGTRFSIEQIVTVLKQVEFDLPAADAILHEGYPSRLSIDGRSTTRVCRVKHTVLISAEICPWGDADKNVNYQEVVHVFVRR